MADTPVLWHLEFSHFNEKARWALDFKGIRHVRRRVLPGLHQIRARRLTGGNTLPVLQLDGAVIGDSTRIIAELERHQPQPALYPADPSERARALELEEFFDEECAHDLRRPIFDEMLRDRRLALDALLGGRGGAQRALASAVFPAVQLAVRREYGISPQSARRAQDKLRAGFDRIAAEAGPSGFLVGEAFSVADLTAAAIMAPLVLPPEFPYPLPPAERWPAGVREFRASLVDHPGFQWVLGTYREHRGPSSEVV